MNPDIIAAAQVAAILLSKFPGAWALLQEAFAGQQEITPEMAENAFIDKDPEDYFE